ncbi:MAG: hypothetical protein IPL09_09340 [Bacteroidetes bacterium]|nr:hypothetical protein [Bacteroidota bacterium]
MRRSIRGPYRWGKYDVLIAPPSSDWSMENPWDLPLQHPHPTGDKSLVSLIAQEMAHSWEWQI